MARQIVLRLVTFAVALAWIALMVFLFTGQFFRIPSQYNYAALTIAVCFEIFILVRLIIQPWGKKMVALGWYPKWVLQPLDIPERMQLAETSGQPKGESDA